MSDFSFPNNPLFNNPLDSLQKDTVDEKDTSNQTISSDLTKQLAKDDQDLASTAFNAETSSKKILEQFKVKTTSEGISENIYGKEVKVIFVGETHDSKGDRERIAGLVNELYKTYKENLLVLTEDDSSQVIKNPQLTNIDENVTSKGWDTFQVSDFLKSAPTLLGMANVNINNFLDKIPFSDAKEQLQNYNDTISIIELIVNILPHEFKQNDECKKIIEKIKSELKASKSTPSEKEIRALDEKTLENLGKLYINLAMAYTESIDAAAIERNRTLAAHTIEAAKSPDNKKIVVIAGKNHIRSPKNASTDSSQVRAVQTLYEQLKTEGLGYLTLTPKKELSSAKTVSNAPTSQTKSLREEFLELTKQTDTSIKLKQTPLPATVFQAVWIAITLLDEKKKSLSQSSSSPSAQSTAGQSENEDWLDEVD